MATWRDRLKGNKIDTRTNEFRVPEDPEKLVGWLDQKRAKGLSRFPEIQMKLNLAYVMGQQWVVWDKDRRQLRRPQNRPDDPAAPVRITANKLGGIVEHFIARLTKSGVEPECRPVTDEDSDVGAAKAATRILGHETHRLHWDALEVNLAFWYVTHGYAYRQITWDPTAGAEVGSFNEGDVETSLNRGEIAVDNVPAFELSVDPNATCMEDARWAVRTVSMTKEAVWEKWGVQVDNASSERSLADEVYALVDNAFDQKQSATDNIQVHQMWMLPCRAAPKGLVVTWAGTTILEDKKPFPYEHGRLPFVQRDLLPGIGTRQGRTWVNDLIPLQADYNDARSREATLRRTLVPKLLYPTGSIDPQRVTTRVEMIGYNPVGEAPKWETPDSGWMAQHEQAMERADSEMGARSGQNDVSSGSAPRSSMPAAAILALQEADDTKLAITAKLMASAIEKEGFQILSLVKQFWTEERLIRTWSEQGTLEVAEFQGSDLPQQLDVHVTAESAMPKSKSARVQLALELWGSPRPIFTDPRQLLRLIDLPGTDFVTESLNRDAHQAQDENDDLFQGVERMIHQWDNHEVHITEHRDKCKGDEYRTLEKAAEGGDPQAQQSLAIIEAHITAHMEAYGAQMGLATDPNAQVDPETGQPIEGAPPEGGGKPGAPQQYLDPQTGKPASGVEVARGAAPSALSGSGIAKRAGMGGPGQPGRVPGISADQQASSMGA